MEDVSLLSILTEGEGRLLTALAVQRTDGPEAASLRRDLDRLRALGRGCMRAEVLLLTAEKGADLAAALADMGFRRCSQLPLSRGAELLRRLDSDLPT